VDTLIGIFAFDDTGNILNFRDFDDDNERIISFYETLEFEDNISKEYEELLLELKNSGFNEFIFDNKKLEQISSQKLGYKTNLESLSLEFKNFRLNLEQQLQKIGLNKTENEISAKYKRISEELIKKKVSQAGGQLDGIIIQTIETLEILKKSISLFSSRIREWYGLHFPELTDKVIEDNIILARLISILGYRNNYTIENIEKNFEFKEYRVNWLINQASKSMGADINLRIIQDYAKQILSLDSYKEELEEYLEDLMNNSAPNLQAIVGSLIGAKLIAKAGGLKKLALCLLQEFNY